MPIFVTRFCKVHDHSLRFLLLGLSLGVSSLLYPQSSTSIESFTNKFDIPNVQSPNAADLGKYGDIPVSLYTGRANISIPLYTLSCRGFQMPISLDYDTSGLLMNALPGWTGHNWTLNVGGVITRRVQGLYDEELVMDNSCQRGRFFSDLDLDELFNNNFITSNNNAGLHDLAPDEFTFNVMGLTGRFFIDSDKQWKVCSDSNVEVLFNVGDTSNYITPVFEKYPAGHKNFPKVIKGFKLRDENGTIYEFGGDNTSIDYSLGFEAQKKTEDCDIPWIASSWYLTKVSDKYGNVLFTLEYERGAFIAQLYHWLEISGGKYHWNDNSSGEATGNVNNPHFTVNTNMFPFSGELISPVYLKRIKTLDNISLQFHSEYIAKSVDEMFIDKEFKERLNDKLTNDYYTRWNYLLNLDSHPFEDGDYNDYDDNSNRNFPYQNGTYPYYYLQATDTITKYQFRQGKTRCERFINPLAQARIRQLDSIRVVADTTSFLCYRFDYDSVPRMHLTGLKEYDSSGGKIWNYTFNYNKFNRVPKDYLTRRIDHWGYLKQSIFNYPSATADVNQANNAGNPSLNGFTDEFIVDGSIGDEAYPNSQDSFYEQRECDSIYSQYGMLKEIVYPTGGKSVLEYEQNDYRYYITDNRDAVVDDVHVRDSIWQANPTEEINYLDPQTHRWQTQVINIPRPSNIIPCGGLRIKKISEYQGNSLLKETSYEYVNPDNGISSGVLFARPKYNWGWQWIWNPGYITGSIEYTLGVFRNNSILPLSNSFGPHVGYSYVKVITNEGHTINRYQNIDDYMDCQPDTAFRSSESSPYDRYTERGFGRGRLLSSKVYDNLNNLVKSSTISYDEDSQQSQSIYTSNLNGGWFFVGATPSEFAPEKRCCFGSVYHLLYPKYKLAIQTDSIKNGNTWDVTQTRYVYKKDTIHLSTPYTHWVDICKTEKESVFHGNDSTSISYHYTFEPAASLSLARKYHDLTPYKVEYEHNNSTYRSDCFQYQLINSHIVPSALISKRTNQAEDTLVTYNEYTETYALKRFTKLGEQPTQVYWNPTQTAVVGMIKGPSNLLDSLTVTDWHQLRQGNPLLHVYSYTYDSLGNIVSITSPNGNTEYFDYQWGNFLTGKRNALQQQTDQYIYHYATEGAN